MTSQHDPTELSPILLITIDNNGNRWILSDILQPLERGAEASFGLCINRDVKRVVADRKTHRYHMRSCITIGWRRDRPDYGGERPFAIEFDTCPLGRCEVAQTVR